MFNVSLDGLLEPIVPLDKKLINPEFKVPFSILMGDADFIIPMDHYGSPKVIEQRR